MITIALWIFSAVVAAIVALVVFDHDSTKRGHRKDAVPEAFPYELSFEVLRNSHRLLDFLHEKVVKYSVDRKTHSIKLFGIPLLIITNDVPSITYVLKDVQNYGKGPIFRNRFFAFLGNGIFNTDGEMWTHHRKTSANLFSIKKFKTAVLETFNEHCDKLVTLIDGKGESSFDIQNLMMKFTLDSIGKIAFGSNIGALDADRVMFAEAFDYCQEAINESFLSPIWIPKRFLTPAGWWYFVSLWRVNDFAYKIVRKKRKNFTMDNAGGDLLSLYLERQEENDSLSDSYLRDVVLNFVIAGRDTTAQALSWSFFRLCKHQDIQQRVYENITEVLKDRNDKHLTYELLQEMRYLDAFCMEVLRLYPSVPKEVKYAYKEDTLPDGTPVPKGALVIFIPWIMGRTEEFWETPLEFQPERFLNTPKPSPFVFTAFQAGPRQCLGQNLAMLEMKCAIARMLLEFQFSLAQPESTVTYVNTITLPIRDGLKVYAKRR